MKKIFLTTCSLAAIFAVTSCDKAPKENKTEEVEVVAEPKEEVAEISLTPFSPSPEYLDGMLDLNSPNDGDKLEAGEVTFDFNVKNYEFEPIPLASDRKFQPFYQMQFLSK